MSLQSDASAFCESRQEEAMRSSALRGLANPMNRRILFALAEGPKTITELAIITGESAPYLVSPLRALRTHRLIRSIRAGRRTRYSMSVLAIQEVMAYLRMLSADLSGSALTSVLPSDRFLPSFETVSPESNAVVRASEPVKTP